jgi:N-acetylmuramoyl-L-alanine amidase
VTGAVAFAPDSARVGSVRPSPNHGERLGPGRPDALVLHYTGMRDGAAAVAWLCDPASGVSCHYVVEEDGAVLQLVPEARRAWHAGRSHWAGDTDLNSASIGIEIVNGGHDFGLPDFPDPQIAAVIALCRDILARHAIAPERVLAHSDIAPGRKQDPGERFPWRRLAEAGVGLWVPPAADDGAAPDAETVARVQAGLARLGYGIAVTGVEDAASRVVVAAFQRRYRPARIDGAIDAGTAETLARLIALSPGPDRAGPPGRA